jgi:triacylglycerol esterase/lipase EstA (alpha/beta hydrolase family)
MKRNQNYFGTEKGVKLCTNTQSKEIVKQFFTVKLSNKPKNQSKYSHYKRGHWSINQGSLERIHSLKDSKSFDSLKTMSLNMNEVFRNLFEIENLFFSLDVSFQN